MVNKLDYEECKLYAESIPGAEHTHLRTLDELNNNSEYIIQPYGKFDKHTGILLSTQRNSNGELYSYHIRDKLVHASIIGSSGSGKTNGFIISTAMNQNGTHSAIYTDVKGEVCKCTYNYLSKIYGKDKVKIINFMEPEKSDYHINYLCVLAHEWLKAYKSKMDAEEKKLVWDRVVSELEKYINILFVEENQKDPTWERTSKDFILAIIFGLFEDLTLTKKQEKKTKRCKTTPEMINFSTVYEIFNTFNWGDGYRKEFDQGGFITKRDSTSLAYRYSNALINNAKNTRANYLQFVSNYLNKINDPRIRAISAFNDFDIEKLGKEPQVVFIIYDISDELLREYVNKVIAQNINILLESSHKQGGKPLEVPVVFYCDEFPTLKPNPVYPNLLATGRGSNIYMHMVIQSYAQLQARYPVEYKAMLENCDLTYFVGTNDAETARKFSEELGRTTIPNPVDYLHGNFSTVTVPVVSQDYLMHSIKDGEVLIKMHRRQPIRGFFEFYYKTKEYQVYPQLVKQEKRNKAEYAKYDALWMHPEECQEDDDDDDLF